VLGVVASGLNNPIMFLCLDHVNALVRELRFESMPDYSKNKEQEAGQHPYLLGIKPRS
jgi:hypothetical protein